MKFAFIDLTVSLRSLPKAGIALELPKISANI